MEEEEDKMWEEIDRAYLEAERRGESLG